MMESWIQWGGAVKLTLIQPFADAAMTLTSSQPLSVVFVVVTNHYHHDRYGNDDEDDK